MTPQEIKEAALTRQIADGWRALHNKLADALGCMPFSICDIVRGYEEELAEVEEIEERLAALRQS
jgi:hypothetical protein